MNNKSFVVVYFVGCFLGFIIGLIIAEINYKSKNIKDK